MIAADYQSISDEVVMHEAGDLEGMVIRVGGRDASVPVLLDAGEGTFYHCTTSRSIARQLAMCLFEGEVRVSGKGKWLRTTEGVWKLQSFDIVAFEQLDERSLSMLVKEMQAVEGSHWNEAADAQEELRKMRED